MDRFQRILVNIMLAIGIVWLVLTLEPQFRGATPELVNHYRKVVGAILEPTLLLAFACWCLGAGVRSLRDGFR